MHIFYYIYSTSRVVDLHLSASYHTIWNSQDPTQLAVHLIIENTQNIVYTCTLISVHATIIAITFLFHE